jgi:hypothetical protein
VRRSECGLTDHRKIVSKELSSREWVGGLRLGVIKSGCAGFSRFYIELPV